MREHTSIPAELDSEKPVTTAGSDPSPDAVYADAAAAEFAQTGRFTALVEQLISRAEGVEGAARVVLLRQAAGLFEHQLGDDESAFVTLEATLPHANGAAPEILAHMERLAARTGRQRELVATAESFIDLLQRRSEEAPSEEEWAALQGQIAALWDGPLRRRDRAAQVLEKILAGMPTHESTARALERIYRDTNDLRPLLGLLARQAAGAAPEERAELAWKRGQVAARLGDEAEARAAYEEALAADPEHGEAMDALAADAENAGDRDRALALLERRARLGPSGVRRAELLFAVGQTAIDRLQRPAEAVRLWAAACAEDPQNLEITRALGRLQRDRGDAAGARASLQVAAALVQGRERVELLLEAAGVARFANDFEAAYEVYAEAHELDPQNDAALDALSELSLELEDWGPALRFAEALAARIDPADKRKLSRVHLRAARAASHLQLQDDMKLSALVERATRANPDAFAEMSGWARAAAIGERFTEAVRLYEALAAHRPARLAPPETAELFFRFAEAHTMTGARAAAVPLLKNALQIDPGHKAARQALAAACLELDDARGAIDQKRALLDRAVDENEAFMQLADMAKLYKTKLASPGQALAAIERALVIKPNDRGLLHDALELYAQDGKWSQALDVLHRLAGAETGPPRGKFLTAAANILHQELHRTDEALDLLDEALALDPEDTRVFERIERLLAERDDVAGLERATLRLIELHGAPETDEARTRAADLWRSVAELRRRREDRAGAIAAYERAADVCPGDSGATAALATLLAEGGDDGRARAAAIGRQALGRAANPQQRAAALRALRAACTPADAAEPPSDLSYVLASALVALEQATPDERAFYERFRPARTPRARRPLEASDWRRLAPADEDRELSRAFGATGKSVAWVRAQGSRTAKLPKRADDTAAGTLFGRALAAVSSGFAEGAPPLHLLPDSPGGLDVLALRDKKDVTLVLVARADVLGPRSEAELAFAAAFGLARLSPQWLVTWPGLVPTDAERRAVLIGAGRLIHPALEAPPELATAATTYADLFRATLAPSALDELALTAPASFASSDEDTIARWRHAGLRTAARAALLLTGDLPAAARALAADASPATLVDDLLAFAVSDEHVAMRADLGLAIEPTPRP